nr:hypothetical protein [Tanacetum cinerariifolium]
MATLVFCDYHNMIAILEKYEHNVDFYRIRDFVEASHIRRNLKLKDEAGISSLQDAELFENLARMGYNILLNQKFYFQKGFNEFSSNIATAVVCLATNRVFNFLKMIFDGMVRNVNNKVSNILMYPRQYSRRARIAQSSALPTAADEPAYPLGDDSQGEACPTVSGLEAEQDKENIIKSSTLPHDSTPRVTSLAADEGSMQQQLNDLMNLCTRLQRQQTEMASKITAQDLEIASLKASIKMLEDKDGGVAEPSGDDATINGRSLETGEEAGVDKMEEFKWSVFPLLKKFPLIHAEEELQMLNDSLNRNNETIAKYLHEYEQFVEDLSIEERIKLINDLVKYQDNYAKVLKYQSQQRKPISKKQQREFYMPIEDFVPMGSKKEGERFKRKGLRLEQDSAKKVKTSEEVSEEDLKTMMQLVPVKEVYVEALQVKHLIINLEIHTKGQRTYWKIIRLGGSTNVYHFFVDMLKHFAREDLNQLWTLVKETLSIRQATCDKDKELWVEMQSSVTQEYPSLIQTFFDTHTVGGVFLRDEDQRLYEEMVRLQGLGTYTDDQIMAMVRRGKQRGHIPGVGRVLAGKGKDVLDVLVPRCNHTSDVDELKGINKQLQKQIGMITKAMSSDDMYSQLFMQLQSQHESGSDSGCDASEDDKSGDDEDTDEDADS